MVANIRAQVANDSADFVGLCARPEGLNDFKYREDMFNTIEIKNWNCLAKIEPFQLPKLSQNGVPLFSHI